MLMAARPKYCSTNWIGAADKGFVTSLTRNNSRTHPVGQKKPNGLGLYDLSGHVWEWCQDWYGSYSSGSQANPSGPSSGSDRVFRGGSWYNEPGLLRAAYRISVGPSARYGGLGFRLALSSQ